MGEILLQSKAEEAARYLKERDPRLGALISGLGVLTYDPAPDAFRFLAEIVIGQMLSNKVAEVLSGRFTALCGGQVTPAAVGALRAEAIRGIGLSTRKAETLRELARLTGGGDLRLEALEALGDDEVTRVLTTVRGIGPWSAKMYLIFVLDRPDVLPWEDGAFLQAYSWLYETEDAGRAAVEKRCDPWRPYRSAGARYLYRALDLGLTRAAFSAGA